jgi:hypothetical protein
VRIRSLTPYALRITLETAARETPASRATSWIVDGWGLARGPVGADADAGEGVLSGLGSAEVTALSPIL